MTEEKNSRSESKANHYDKLMECSEKGPEGIKEWNRWRKENLFEEIWLQGAGLVAANLQGANLVLADLQGAKLYSANLQGADLRDANLQGADLMLANLQGAILRYADLQGADLGGANLQGAKFIGVIVNGSTSFLGCKIDEDTDFRYTGLENMRIESGTKTLLKYNIRRLNWRDWYKEHLFLQWPAKLFFSISNYGISTSRIIAWFFGFATVFALVYYFVPSLINDLHVTGKWYSGLVRACYFSIVTMTTLGFGDMYADKQSVTGHILLIIQVILGYIILGTLVTRVTVAFTSDGPTTGSYTPMDEETKELLAKLKEDEGN